MLLRWSTFLLLSLHSFHAYAFDRLFQFQLEPHAYSGPRGTEPTAQTVAQTLIEFKGTEWDLALHLEGELLGRRDLSFDLDRAWIRTPLTSSDTSSTITWGRIHPWDVSLHPNRNQPWSFLAQNQSQNRGILQGSGFSQGVFPQPIVMGWVGAHFWSDQSHTNPFEFGLSVSPVFIPSMGPATDLSETAPASVGRFGRRPPGFVELQGQLIPLTYQINSSQLLKDVILQPQLMAQASWRYTQQPSGPEAWLIISRAPSPDPTPETSGFLQVRGSDLNAVAVVIPKFSHYWLANLTHDFPILHAPFELSIFNSLQLRDDRTWGYEIGTRGKYFSLSLADEFRPAPPPGQLISNTNGNYIDLLIQADLKLPILNTLAFYSGVKSQLRQEDSYWVRTGVEWLVHPTSTLNVGVDLFQGVDQTYFGEWRTNNRIYSQLQFRLPS